MIMSVIIIYFRQSTHPQVCDLGSFESDYIIVNCTMILYCIIVHNNNNSTIDNDVILLHEK